jgi:N6-adenosine-specific RNA methylase IME4
VSEQDVRRQYTKDEIVAALVEAAREFPALRIRDYMRWVAANRGNPSHMTVIKRFGSWNAAVQAALGGIRLPSGLILTEPLPDRRYATIVIDPPWQYKNNGSRNAARRKYPTMSLDDICALPVQAFAEDNAHLYLWATVPLLDEAFDVLRAWGFTYKTAITWVKPQMGMGNWWRVSTEHVLFGVRGSLPARSRGTMNWFQANRGRHSAKPEAFYDLVEEVSPGPYIDVFARRRRFNWDVWGDEA